LCLDWHQSSLILASWARDAHLVSSVLTISPSRPGLLPTASAPWPRSFSLISGFCTTTETALDKRSMTGAGVLLGTNMAYHESTSKSATPDSCTVGTSGNIGLRRTVDTASGFRRPVFTKPAAAGIDTHSSGI